MDIGETLLVRTTAEYETYAGRFTPRAGCAANA